MSWLLHYEEPDQGPPWMTTPAKGDVVEYPLSEAHKRYMLNVVSNKDVQEMQRKTLKKVKNILEWQDNREKDEKVETVDAPPAGWGSKEQWDIWRVEHVADEKALEEEYKDFRKVQANAIKLFTEWWKGRHQEFKAKYLGKKSTDAPDRTQHKQCLAWEFLIQYLNLDDEPGRSVTYQDTERLYRVNILKINDGSLIFPYLMQKDLK